MINKHKLYPITLVSTVMSLMLLSTLATANPGMIITKSAFPLSYDAIGENITYDYTVTNSGNVSFTGTIIVADNRTGAFSITSNGLDVGQNVTGTENYTITQLDLDAGYVTNTPYATGSFGGNIVNSNTATAIVYADQSPALTLTKIPNPSTYTDGQSVIYTYSVTNVGNVTLTSVNVTDTTFGQAIALGTTTLAPGASTTGTYTYQTTHTDYDNGSVVDNALAKGTFQSTVVQAPASATVIAVNQNPALTITKIPNPSTYNVAGQNITYYFTVTNSGNGDIYGNITITDSILGQISIPNDDLAPGQSITETATYSVTQADIDAGFVTNSAYATNNNINSNTANVTVNATHKALPVITWSNPANIIFGTALNSTQLDATSSVVGSFIYIPAAGTVLGSGIHTLQTVFTPKDTMDYTAATTSVQINVLTPVQKIQQVITFIQGLVTSGKLNNGQANSLIAKLNAAKMNINHENTQAATNELNAFINEVNADIKIGKLSSTDGQTLIDEANAVIDAIK